MPRIMSASVKRPSENRGQIQIITLPSFFFDLLTEIRSAIYSPLICLLYSHVITLRECKLGIMEHLSLTCSQLYYELSKWTNVLVQRPSLSRIIIDPTFALLNAKTTSIVWHLDSFHVSVERPSSKRLDDRGIRASIPVVGGSEPAN